jgi:polyhydroxyalkanoate synthesis regulator phasin
VILLAADGVTGFLTEFGPSAAVVFVVVVFLRHIAETATTGRKVTEDIIGRVEAMEEQTRAALDDIATKFTGAVAEFRAEHRATINDLLQINRETVQAMGSVGGRVGDLGTQVSALGQSVGELRGAVTELRHEVGRKADKDDRAADRAERAVDRAERERHP